MKIASIGLLLIMVHAAFVRGGNVEIIAHRGESADAPENTLAAFRLAWERRDTTIELDVHLTSDDQLIVAHDPDAKRICSVDKKFRSMSLAEAQKLDAGSWKGPEWKAEKVPTLAECLATIPTDGRCFLEIKEGPEAVPAVVKAVNAAGKKPGQLVIISFNALTVAAAKRDLPDIKAYYLSSFKKDKATGLFTPTVDELIVKAKASRADGLNLSHQGPLDRDGVQKIKAAGLVCMVWTVDDPVIAKRFVEYGVDGVTTNKAAWMRKQLGPDKGD